MQDATRRIEVASELMSRFAERTGLTGTQAERRYLWTDAFAVCNFLALARATGDESQSKLAALLVERVHHTLGRHRNDDPRSGWISGLGESEGERHPTRGGLRIGKRLPERQPDEALDRQQEWDRDGQYLHYLTHWMHALDQLARYAAEPRFNLWARELAATACAAFMRPSEASGSSGLVWKMSIDLSRPLVTATGQHDALDFAVTCLQLRATTSRFTTAQTGPTLERELEELSPLLNAGTWVTADALGVGGLLTNGCRLAELVRAGADPHTELLNRIVSDATRSLRLFTATSELRRLATTRLAFRELGLAIGLAGIEHLEAAQVSGVEALRSYAPLAPAIEDFWLEPRHRETPSWGEHQDIDEVMLATSLVPDGFLNLHGLAAKPAERST